MRRELLDAVAEAGRVNSTATVLFHATVSERVGLGPTDTKALDILHRFGPLTAGEIGEHTGLASASVTSLIDRLEARGFVRRTRDTKDRRRVIVEVVPENLGQLAAFFGPFLQSLDELLASYTDEQLVTICDFLTRSAVWLHERIQVVRGSSSMEGSVGE